MTIIGRSWEMAEEHGLQHYYIGRNGVMDGAVRFYDGDECVAVFEITDEWGFGKTYGQELELLEGTWPPKKGEKES